MAAPVTAADGTPLLRTRVTFREQPFVWMWLGVGVFGLIGVAAVMNGPDWKQAASANRRRRAARRPAV